MIRNFVFSYLSFSLILLTILFSACNSDYTPKPKGYPRIIFPEKTYRSFSSEFCPFTFEYPAYANVIRDTTFFGATPPDPCWLNIDFPEFKAKIHLSYKTIDEDETLEGLLNDTHFLTFKHTVKAEYIDERYISNQSLNVYGLVYYIGGNAASSVQFYLTDSIDHYLRGALYFFSTPNIDSLKPVVNFINEDIDHLINTFQWKGD